MKITFVFTRFALRLWKWGFFCAIRLEVVEFYNLTPVCAKKESILQPHASLRISGGVFYNLTPICALGKLSQKLQVQARKSYRAKAIQLKVQVLLALLLKKHVAYKIPQLIEDFIS